MCFSFSMFTCVYKFFYQSPNSYQPTPLDHGGIKFTKQEDEKYCSFFMHLQQMKVSSLVYTNQYVFFSFFTNWPAVTEIPSQLETFWFLSILFKSIVHLHLSILLAIHVKNHVLRISLSADRTCIVCGDSRSLHPTRDTHATGECNPWKSKNMYRQRPSHGNKQSIQSCQRYSGWRGRCNRLFDNPAWTESSIQRAETHSKKAIRHNQYIHNIKRTTMNKHSSKQQMQQL